MVRSISRLQSWQPARNVGYEPGFSEVDAEAPRVGMICLRSHGHRDRGRGHFGDQRPADLRTARMPQQRGEGPGVCLPRLAPTQRPQRGWPTPRTPRGPRRGAGWAGKEPPAPGGSASAPGICGAPTVQGALPPPRDCAERMRCLRVNRACFPFTPSGSVLLKNFLLLALGEYAFLACTARGRQLGWEMSPQLN